MALSERGQQWAKPDEGLLLWTILEDMWDAQTNPNGYASLGVAENTLMHETLSKHIKTNLDLPNHAFTYGDGPRGTIRLKEIMAKFLTSHLRPVEIIQPNHITITNGCSSALNHLAFVFADPNDVFLLGQPHYGAFIHDFTMRSETFVKQVPFKSVDPFGLKAVQAYETALLECQREGKKVTGLILCHPHNPLGRCYPPETLIELMRLCQKYGLHFISDEIYALTVWENTIDHDPPPVAFKSVLAIDSRKIIDQDRVHVIWGTSKDFGANGLRLGAIISQRSRDLHSALLPVALFSSASSLAEHAIANVLDDSDFVSAYIAENRRLLASRYALVTKWAKNNDIIYAPGANAAFFLWVDLGTAYKARNPDQEVDDLTAHIMASLLTEKVFLASGKQFGSELSGWFRIVFSHSEELLVEGLERVLRALGWKRELSGYISPLQELWRSALMPRRPDILRDFKCIHSERL